jgi:AcrR family transcriptional regulator
MSDTVEIAKPRRAGRRAKSATAGEPRSMSRAEIIAHALKIARNEPVGAITIKRLSRELDVTPSLIHYFTGGRDKLLSAVLNEAMTKDTPDQPRTGNWRGDLEQLLRTSLDFQLKWKGITTYVHTNNRNRLFQDVEDGEEDFGLTFVNRVGKILMDSGLAPERAAMAYHLMMLFLSSVSFAHINRQEPAAHKRYLKDRAAKFDSAQYPGVAFIMSDFVEITTKTTFEAGLRGLLNTFESWIPEGNSKTRTQNRKVGASKG